MGITLALAAVCGRMTGYTEVIVAKSNFTFAAHDVVNIHFHVGFSGKTGIVAAHNDFNARLEGAHQFDNAASSSPSSPAKLGAKGRKNRYRCTQPFGPHREEPQVTQ